MTATNNDHEGHNHGGHNHDGHNHGGHKPVFWIRYDRELSVNSGDFLKVSR